MGSTNDFLVPRVRDPDPGLGSIGARWPEALGASDKDTASWLGCHGSIASQCKGHGPLYTKEVTVLSAFI